jgi:hypothetical protein
VLLRQVTCERARFGLWAEKRSPVRNTVVRWDFCICSPLFSLPILSRRKDLEPRTITIAQKVIIIGKQNGAGCFSKRRKLPVVWIWYEVELLGVRLAVMAILRSEKFCYLTPRQGRYLIDDVLCFLASLGIPNHSYPTQANLLHNTTRSTVPIESSCNEDVGIENDC